MSFMQWQSALQQVWEKGEGDRLRWRGCKKVLNHKILRGIVV